MHKLISLIWNSFLIISLFAGRTNAQDPLELCDLPVALADEFNLYPGSQNVLNDPEKLKAWQNLYSSPAIRTNLDWLTVVSAWQRAGLVIEDQGGALFIIKNGATEIGRIQNGNLLSTGYSGGFPTANPIGPVINGCQVFQHGGQFIVKRVPNTTGIDPQYISVLQGASNAHCLEKHGFDVSDEALKYRAKTGRAPNGQMTGPVSGTKFYSASEMNRALEELAPPDSEIFKDASTLPNASSGNVAVEYEFSIPMGYGYEAVTLNRVENIKKVLIVYSQKANGDWYILTMYPEL